MKLKFLTWNISYAYGPGSAGISKESPLPYEQKPRSHFDSALRTMSTLIGDLNIDVAFLQEVDFDSKRSHHVHQLDWLARTSNLQYRLPIVSWDHPYIPYPGLNPKNHFGKVVSGGGIISRFPLEFLRDDFLPKPRSNPAIYNYFYLQRYLQIFKVVLPETNLNCANFHLEAFSDENRELHCIRLQDRLIDYDLSLAAGDFNGDFELSPERRSRWDLHLSPLPSFPSQDRVLDGWINEKKKIIIEKVTTLDTGTVSDHLPVMIEFSIGE